MLRPSAFVAAAALLLGLVLPVQAGRFNRVLSVGDQAPRWQGLPGTDGRQHRLAEFLNRGGYTVLVFSCTVCPCALGCERRIEQIHRDYAGKGVQVVVINVGDTPSDELPKLRQRLKRQGFTFLCLRDATRRVARAYGATVTPQVFVLDAQGRIAYMGTIDDQVWKSQGGPVEHPYLRDALDALLRGKRPRLVETRPLGCEIPYDDAE